MQFVSLEKYQRTRLTQSQREFFLGIVPLANFVQMQTINKAFVTDKPTLHGIFASIICANIILKSKFGEHPVAKEDNLALLLAHKYWKKSTVEYEGKKYRAYKNWREFAIDYSDLLAFQSGFEDILKINSRNEQLRELALREISTYYDMMTQIIRDYGLSEFDYYEVG